MDFLIICSNAFIMQIIYFIKSVSIMIAILTKSEEAQGSTDIVKFHYLSDYNYLKKLFFLFGFWCEWTTQVEAQL